MKLLDPAPCKWYGPSLSFMSGLFYQTHLTHSSYLMKRWEVGRQEWSKIVKEEEKEGRWEGERQEGKKGGKTH
jgi:hypothetical protein